MESNQLLHEKFKETVGIVLNNWTALKLALEHGQGGPQNVVTGKIQTLFDTITSLLIQDKEWDEVADFLTDFMDEQLDTLLEDGSEDQVARHLWQLYQFLKAGNVLEIDNQIGNFPIKSSILVEPVQNIVLAQSVEESSEEEMEEDPDPGWTVVTRKR